MINKIDLHPECNFTFSSCVVAGDYVFTAHHSGVRMEDGTWPESIETQTEQCFKNLETTLRAADATLSDVVKTTVFLKNAGDFRKMREVYKHFFTDGYPARSGIITEFLDPECLIQIEAVAYKPR